MNALPSVQDEPSYLNFDVHRLEPSCPWIKLPSIVFLVGYNSTKEKQKLQNVMAFGSEIEPTPMAVRPHPLSEEETEMDRFEEVLKEIEERKEFLEEMEALGQGQKYRTKLMTEISQVLIRTY